MRTRVKTRCQLRQHLISSHLVLVRSLLLLPQSRHLFLCHHHRIDDHQTHRRRLHQVQVHINTRLCVQVQVQVVLRQPPTLRPALQVRAFTLRHRTTASPPGVARPSKQFKTSSSRLLKGHRPTKPPHPPPPTTMAGCHAIAPQPTQTHQTQISAPSPPLERVWVTPERFR
jgi:hypothetical protein